MLPALAIAFAATAATATETGSRRRALAAGETRTQRITSFLPFVNVDGEAFYGQRQLAIVAAMAVRDFNARNGHLVKRFAALDEPCDVELEIQYFNTFFRPERALRVQAPPLGARAPRGAAAHAPRRTAGAPQRPRATRRLRGEDPQPCSTGSRFKRHQSPRASLLAPPRTPHALDAPRTTAQLDGRRCARILSLAQTSRSSAHPAASKFDA